MNVKPDVKKWKYRPDIARNEVSQPHNNRLFTFNTFLPH